VDPSDGYCHVPGQEERGQPGEPAKSDGDAAEELHRADELGRSGRLRHAHALKCLGETGRAGLDGLDEALAEVASGDGRDRHVRPTEQLAVAVGSEDAADDEA
jgi:hypothetical protein